MRVVISLRDKPVEEEMRRTARNAKLAGLDRRTLFATEPSGGAAAIIGPSFGRAATALRGAGWADARSVAGSRVRAGGGDDRRPPEEDGVGRGVVALAHARSTSPASRRWTSGTGAALRPRGQSRRGRDRREARRGEEGREVRGPLHGIPILIKDNIGTADRMTTTAGSLGARRIDPGRRRVHRRERCARPGR